MNEFFKNKLVNLRVEDYLNNDNNDLRMIKYFEKFDDEISNIENLRNNYLTTIISSDKIKIN